MINSKPKTSNETYLKYFLLFWFSILILLGLIIGSSAGDDYSGYILNWERSLSEKNPWQNVSEDGQINAYGPLHPLMSFFFSINPNFPKLIYMLTFVSSIIFLFLELDKKNYFKKLSNTSFFFLAIPFNFVVINYVFIFGHNDSMVAGFLIISMIFKYKKKDNYFAIFFTLSILEKYYTAVLVPIFLIDYLLKKDYEKLYKFILYGISTGTIILLLIFIFYGFNLKFLSNFLIQESSPHFFSYLASVDWFINFYSNRLGNLKEYYMILVNYNTFLMLIFYLLFLYFSFRKKFKIFFMMSISLWIVFTLYAGSFMTYYMSLFCIFAMIPLEEKNSLTTSLQYLVLPYFIFLSVISFSYLFISDAFGDIMGHARNVLGFINLFLSLYSIFFLIYFYNLNKKLN